MKLLRYKLTNVGNEEWIFDELKFDRINYNEPWKLGQKNVKIRW